MQAQAEHFEAELRRAYREYFGQDYDFAPADFQRVVSARLESRGGGDPLLAQLPVLAEALRDCGDCAIEALRGSETGLAAEVSSASGILKSAADGRHAVRQDNGRWRVEVGGAP